VVGLEVALSEPGTVRSAALVEPPLLGLLPGATAGVSADAEAIAAEVRAGGEEGAYELFLGGDLPSLGAGANRLGGLADRGVRAPRSFLVEIPAVPEWPLERTRFDRLEAALAVVTTGSTPPVLEEAADQLLAWLDEGGTVADRIQLDESDLAQAVASLARTARGR